METEIKLNTYHMEHPEQMLEDTWLSALCMPGSVRVIEMDSRYFDTSDAQLRNQNVSLRMRQENDVQIVTIKAGSTSNSGLHQRMEWSAVLPPEQSDWLDDPHKGFDTDWFMRTAVSEGDPDDLLFDWLRQIAGKPLCELCRVTFTRIACDIGFGDTLMELAIDQGFLIADQQQKPVSELELELKEGDARDLMALGDELQRRFHLALESKSKLERCLILNERGTSDVG